MGEGKTENWQRLSLANLQALRHVSTSPQLITSRVIGKSGLAKGNNVMHFIRRCSHAVLHNETGLRNGSWSTSCQNQFPVSEKDPASFTRVYSLKHKSFITGAHSTMYTLKLNQNRKPFKAGWNRWKTTLLMCFKVNSIHHNSPNLQCSSTLSAFKKCEK